MNAPTDLKWAAKFPDLGTGPIPVEPCISPEFYEEERKKVFLKSWLKVGRVEEIAKPGDYKKATQRIWTGGATASSIELPIVPAL